MTMYETNVEKIPMCFWKHFGTNIIVIVDCFEIFINKPKNILARAQKFSSNKHYNTSKFSIVLAPQGGYYKSYIKGLEKLRKW